MGIHLDYSRYISIRQPSDCHLLPERDPTDARTALGRNRSGESWSDPSPSEGSSPTISGCKDSDHGRHLHDLATFLASYVGPGGSETEQFSDIQRVTTIGPGL